MLFSIKNKSELTEISLKIPSVPDNSLTFLRAITDPRHKIYSSSVAPLGLTFQGSALLIRHLEVMLLAA
jgi:hypothetical protein